MMKMGSKSLQIAKEVVADRKGGACAENKFVKTQIFKDGCSVKSLKFSAYYEGKFFNSIDQFLKNIDPTIPDDSEYVSDRTSLSVPFISNEEIQKSAQVILDQINYRADGVDLAIICSMRSIELQFSDQEIWDGNGNLILGSANFDRKSITINSHDNKQRERFTVAHEIGHFCLQHDRFLRSESILESDLMITGDNTENFNYERLEFQANSFASHLLLPKEMFIRKVAECRSILEMKDIGYGYIFVDDQPCNYGPYNILLTTLSSYFDVSKQVIEIMFRKMEMLTDQRKQPDSLPFLQFRAHSRSFP